MCVKSFELFIESMVQLVQDEHGNELLQLVLHNVHEPLEQSMELQQVVLPNEERCCTHVL